MTFLINQFSSRTGIKEPGATALPAMLFKTSIDICGDPCVQFAVLRFDHVDKPSCMPGACITHSVVAESLAGIKIEGRGVDAVAKSSRCRAIIENMAEMGITVLTTNLGPIHAMTVISMMGYGIDIDKGIKAGPAATGIKLGFRFEKGRTTTDTGVGTVILLVDIGPGERRFGASLAGYIELLFSQLLSPLSFGF